MSDVPGRVAAGVSVRGSAGTERARYIRAAIIREAKLAPELDDRLLGPDFDEPRILALPVRGLKGTVSLIDPSAPTPEDPGALEVLGWANPVRAVGADGDKIRLQTSTEFRVDALPENTQMTFEGTFMIARGVEGLDAGGPEGPFPAG